MNEPGPRRRKPHRCDETCVCTVHGTDLIYSSAFDDHACQDASCKYGHGGAPGKESAAEDAKSVTCPRCGRTSRNPNDVREGYCGNCHDRTSEPRDYLSPGFPDRHKAWTIQEMRRNGWSTEGLARVFGLTPFGVELYLRKETRV